MDDRAFEQKLVHLMSQDLSVGTEAFRDALLERCLNELDSEEEGIELSDDQLDLLAAAGDMYSRLTDEPSFNNK